MRGEGLDRLEILASLGAILSNMPELSRFAGQLGRKEGKDKNDASWLKNLLLAIFTDQDNAALESYVALMTEDDQEYIRHFIGRMKTRDTIDKGKRVGSLAAKIFLRKNPTKTTVEEPKPVAQQKGKKGGSEPAPVVTKQTTISPWEDTADDVRVKYLNSVVARIKRKMGISGTQNPVGFSAATTSTANKMTLEAAIDEVIDEMEASGFISTESLGKSLDEIMRVLEEANVSLLYTMFEARLVLSAEEYKRIAQVVKDTTDRAYPNVPDVLPENASERETKAFRAHKDFYEEGLSVLLTAAMDVKVNSKKPQRLWRQPLQEHVDNMRHGSRHNSTIWRSASIAIISQICGEPPEKSPSEEILQQHNICIVPQKISSERLPLKWMLIAIAVLGLFLWLMGGLPTQ